MSTNIGIGEIPDTGDIELLADNLGVGLEELYGFLSTHPVAVNTILLIQSLLSPLR